MAADNSDKTGTKQNKRGTNPNSLANLQAVNGKNGRHKIPQEFKDIVKANTVDAINKVIYLMNNAGKEDIQLKAAETILDRAYGKAAQPIVGDNEHDPIKVEATQYTKMIVERARKIVEDGSKE